MSRYVEICIKLPVGRRIELLKAMPSKKGLLAELTELKHVLLKEISNQSIPTAVLHSAAFIALDGVVA